MSSPQELVVVEAAWGSRRGGGGVRKVKKTTCAGLRPLALSAPRRHAAGFTRTRLPRLHVLVAQRPGVLQVVLRAVLQFGHPVWAEGALDEHHAVALVLGAQVVRHPVCA